MGLSGLVPGHDHGTRLGLAVSAALPLHVLPAGSFMPRPAAQEFGACLRCTHHRQDGEQLLCREQTVAGVHRAMPVAWARATGGGCGPDAMRMHWPDGEMRPPRRWG
jgi:hypothetical protein